jgi:uroporphyrinogen III methyltransferase/synthase
MPLEGKKILITRAREQSAGFAEHLRKLGAEVVVFPTIEIVPPFRWDKVDEAIDRIESYDWIIFTSVNGVHFFWHRLRERGKNLSLPSSIKVCAIGPATAKQLKEYGIPVDYIPKEYIAEAILEGFGKMGIQGKRILLARAKIARDVLPKGLNEMGAELDVIEVYRTVKPVGGSKRLRKLFEGGGVDVITFTSSSTVNHFVELLKEENLKGCLKGVVIACIGPVAAQTARSWGMKVEIEAEEYTIPGLTQAIAGYYGKKERLK